MTWLKRNRINVIRGTVIILFLLLAVWAISLNHWGMVIAEGEPWLWITTALVSVGPELAGIIIGVVTIDYLNERRQTEQFKAQLIRQMGSPHHNVAEPAARELAHYGWLYDGSLHGADLRGACLTGADLAHADLSRANFGKANLSKAYLGVVNLNQASLWEANLKGAYLWEANLRGANLEDADLSMAEDWTIEQLQQAKTLDGATMPNGVRLKHNGNELRPSTNGPTFNEWKVRYLFRHGGTVTDARIQFGTDSPDDSELK